ncbi:TraX family protein [Streptococcus merionis]|uniref:TraX family protein n=1 Tax=Streptococcus merionis TaxID=400065 RepID=UPI003517E0E9
MPQSQKGLTSFALRNLAMVLMLIDHTAATFFPEQLWLRYIGRLAFPIFAFLIVEGYFHTRHFPRYLLRLVGLAILTDIPFNLMVNSTWSYAPFQNVIWTFVIGLITIWGIDQSRARFPRPIWYLTNALLILSSTFLADALGTDYHSLGVIMILGFYFFRGNTAQKRSGQLSILVLANVILPNLQTLLLIGYSNLALYWDYYGFNLISPQVFALLALPLIWSYNGQQGYHTKMNQTFNYLFYPLHMLILGLLATMVF